MTIKTLKEMMQDADKAFIGETLPIVFLDTGAVIDICRSSKEEEMRQKGKSDMPLQEIYADHFLMNFAGKYQTVISPSAYIELARHYNVTFNGNCLEIKKAICPLINKFSTDYERLQEFVRPHIPANDIDRYRVYWATKFACEEDEKKCSEGFSDVDREILDNAVLFSRYFSKDGKSADPVAVFSSDEHIFKGVKMLNELGYHNLITLSSRSRNGRK